MATPLDLDSRCPDNLLALLEEAGFSEVLVGAGEHVSRRYALAEDGAYLEFLGHRQGDGGGRHARRVQRFGGLVAESLARVDILLHRPWVTRVEDGGGSIEVQVVNPVSFVVQKLLVLPKRHTPIKKANDAVYLHDTLDMFSENLDTLAQQDLLLRLSRKVWKDIRRAAETKLFVDNDLMRDAAEIARGTRTGHVTAASMSASLERGLARLLPSAGFGAA